MIEPRTVEIAWTFEVKCGPGTPITETGVWGNKITVSDVAPDATNAGIGMQAANLLGTVFLETFLVAMGVAEKDAITGLMSAKTGHRVLVKVVKKDE